GDHGLAGEVLKQSNLLVVEWADFLPHEYNKADYVAFLEHWHRQDSAIAAKLDGPHHQRIALKVRLLDCDVGGFRHLLCWYRAAKCDIRTGPQWLALHEFRKRSRRVMYRDDAVSITLPQAKRAKLGLAKPSRICQHGIEHRLQIAGRTRNDL